MVWLTLLIGPDKVSLTWWQETDRALIVFFVGLILIRLSGLRTFSRFSPLDTVVAIVIGSNLSRTITGNAAFGGTLVASLVFVVLHWVLAQLAYHFPSLGALLKGKPKTLVLDGEPQAQTMRAEALSHGDLMEALRLKGLSDLSEVERAMIERSGDISLKRRDG